MQCKIREVLPSRDTWVGMFPWPSKLSDSNCVVGSGNRQHNSFFPSHSLQHPHQVCLSGEIKKSFEEHTCKSTLIRILNAHLLSVRPRHVQTRELLRILQTPAAIMLCNFKSPPVRAQVSGKIRPHFMNVFKCMIKMSVPVIKQQDKKMSEKKSCVLQEAIKYHYRIIKLYKDMSGIATGTVFFVL